MVDGLGERVLDEGSGWLKTFHRGTVNPFPYVCNPVLTLFASVPASLKKKTKKNWKTILKCCAESSWRFSLLEERGFGGPMDVVFSNHSTFVLAQRNIDRDRLFKSDFIGVFYYYHQRDQGNPVWNGDNIQHSQGMFPRGQRWGCT